MFTFSLALYGFNIRQRSETALRGFGTLAEKRQTWVRSRTRLLSVAAARPSKGWSYGATYESPTAFVGIGGLRRGGAGVFAAPVANAAPPPNCSTQVNDTMAKLVPCVTQNDLWNHMKK